MLAWCPISNLSPVSCSARGHLPIGLEGASWSGDPVSIPVPYSSPCFAACLAWQLSRAALGTPHPQFTHTHPVLLPVQQGSACRGHVGCSELTCRHARASLWSPSRLQGPVCPCAPCPHASQQTEPIQPLSAGMGMGTVPASALAGKALESAAKCSGILPPSRSCKVSNWS